MIGLLVLTLAIGGCRRPSAPTDQTESAESDQAREFTNSLGMKFVPLPGTNVLISVYETRASEFALFVKEANVPWIPPDAEREGEYPAANVTWDDAVAFCAWLTRREREAGHLEKGTYRLPTDAEWSAAAGLPPGSTAAEDGIRYAWGTDWPPPKDSGNFAGEEAQVDRSEFATYIEGYTDPYPKLSPVGKFKPNVLGLYDLAGNVLEWCSDSAPKNQGKLARGGSWINGDAETLSLHHRAVLAPRAGLNVVGLRCVLDRKE